MILFLRNNTTKKGADFLLLFSIRPAIATHLLCCQQNFVLDAPYFFKLVMPDLIRHPVESATNTGIPGQARNDDI